MQSPIFKLAEFGEKIDYLCTTVYPVKAKVISFHISNMCSEVSPEPISSIFFLGNRWKIALCELLSTVENSSSHCRQKCIARFTHEDLRSK